MQHESDSRPSVGYRDVETAKVPKPPRPHTKGSAARMHLLSDTVTLSLIMRYVLGQV